MDHIARDREHATGRVNVTLDAEQRLILAVVDATRADRMRVVLRPGASGRVMANLIRPLAQEPHKDDVSSLTPPFDRLLNIVVA